MSTHSIYFSEKYGRQQFVHSCFLDLVFKSLFTRKESKQEILTKKHKFLIWHEVIQLFSCQNEHETFPGQNVKMPTNL